MDNDLEKYTLGEGVELIAVPVGRFKTNEISISFATALQPQLPHTVCPQPGTGLPLWG